MPLFKRYVDAIDERIDDLGMLIPKHRKRGAKNLAANNALSLSRGHVHKGLLFWRAGKSPVSDFNVACDVLDEMKTYADPDVATGLESAHIYIRGIRYLVDRDIDEEIKVGDRRDSPLPMMELYIVQCVRNEVADWLTDTITAHMRSEGGLYEASLSTYRQLMGIEETNDPVDDLVRQAEKNWTARKKSRQFSDTFSVFGDDVENDLYVDWMLAVVLKKIGWVETSIHRWIY